MVHVKVEHCHAAQPQGFQSVEGCNRREAHQAKPCRPALTSCRSRTETLRTEEESDTELFPTALSLWFVSLLLNFSLQS